MTARPRVLLCFNSTVRREYATEEGLARLERVADWEWLPSEGKPVEGKAGWATPQVRSGQPALGPRALSPRDAA